MLIALALLCQPAEAQSKAFAAYSDSVGVWYSLPSGWEIMGHDDWENIEREALAAVTPLSTQTELDRAVELSPFLILNKPGNEKGGAVITFRIDHIPPSDQITQDEVRSFTPWERRIILQAVTAAGRQLAVRKADLLGITNSTLVDVQFANVGHLTCFRTEYGGTHPNGLSPREFIYDCPTGKMALMVWITYNRDLHRNLWPGINTVLQSVTLETGQ